MDDEKRKAEMARGQEITAFKLLARRFDETWKPEEQIEGARKPLDPDRLSHLPNNRDGTPRNGT